MKLASIAAVFVLISGCDKTKACDENIKVKITSDNFEQVISTAKNKCEGEKLKLVNSIVAFVGVIQKPTHKSLGDTFAGKSLQDYIDDMAKMQAMSPSKSLQQITDEMVQWGQKQKAELAEAERKKAEEQRAEEEMGRILKADSIEKIGAHDVCLKYVETTKVKNREQLNRLPLDDRDYLKKSCPEAAFWHIWNVLLHADLVNAKDSDLIGKTVIQLSEMVKPGLWAKVTSNWNDRVVFKVKFSNSSDKAIEAFQGHIQAKDKLDNMLGKYEIKVTDAVIEAGKALEKEFEFSATTRGDAEVAQSKGEALKLEFVGKKLSFAGAKAGASH